LWCDRIQRWLYDGQGQNRRFVAIIAGYTVGILTRRVRDINRCAGVRVHRSWLCAGIGIVRDRTGRTQWAGRIRVAKGISCNRCCCNRCHVFDLSRRKIVGVQFIGDGARNNRPLIHFQRSVKCARVKRPGHTRKHGQARIINNNIRKRRIARILNRERIGDNIASITKCPAAIRIRNIRNRLHQLYPRGWYHAFIDTNLIEPKVTSGSPGFLCLNT